MNDTELDELLDLWQAPKPDEAIRRRVRAEVEAQARRPHRALFTRMRFIAAAACVVIAVALASSVWAARFVPPFVVESEITRYDVSGQAECFSAVCGGPETPVIASYNDRGSEVILSWSHPQHPFYEVYWKAQLAATGAQDRALSAFLSILERLNPRITEPDDYPPDTFAVVYPTDVGHDFIVGRRDELLSSGCRTTHGGAEVVGQEVILNYPTIAIRQEQFGGTTTIWMAPDLSCSALQARVLRRQDDGTFTLISERKAVKVTLNP